MNKLSNLFIVILFVQSITFASQSTPYYFDATYPTTKFVRANGGVINANIDNNTGALSAILTPSFLIGTNSYISQTLTMSATATTTSGNVNAIFNNGSNKYIVLTNNNVTPTAASVNNITGGSPTLSSNPNAIAYQVNNPTTYYGLSVTYNSTNKNWQLTTTTYGQMSTTLEIPATTPLANTFSAATDDAGSYKATITLSFN